jgi:hypothetical protein
MMEIPMKYFAFCLFLSASLFADQFSIENETSYRKVAIQWASTARMVQENNDSLIQRDPIGKENLHYLTELKEIVFSPKNAAYFRVLVWDKGDILPEFLTNWVEFVPGKTYLLRKEHLTPLLLINGMGC